MCRFNHRENFTVCGQVWKQQQLQPYNPRMARHNVSIPDLDWRTVRVKDKSPWPI
jgi:hypothetical protein